MSRPSPGPLNLHAGAVEVEGRGCLILGASGAGKSALALDMIARGARLVADDRTLVERRGDALVAAAPPTLRGVIEARGVGLLNAPFAASAPLVLAVDLDRAPPARMPQPHEIGYLGVDLELIFGAGVPNLATILVHLLRHGRAR